MGVSSGAHGDNAVTKLMFADSFWFVRAKTALKRLSSYSGSFVLTNGRIVQTCLCFAIQVRPDRCKYRRDYVTLWVLNQDHERGKTGKAKHSVTMLGRILAVAPRRAASSQRVLSALVSMLEEFPG